ncbi:dynein axonemal intermediate chain 4-like isoform X2 [Haliotis rufescens]|uniref:dynein axonemal intermediate chain 4-like isoform X2 n=1 Tax=Haliotis rufescens TaxID=6454 RepID=UPI00201F903E|nr:dynein axonemal intermediate chain 4-like isoform X2 [Haliotis rufescens]
MSTGKPKKHLGPGMQQNPGQSTTSKKSNATHSMTRSKYGGGTRNTVFGSSRSNLVSSASRKSVGVAASEKSVNVKIPIQVVDESGNDVTPISLLHLDPSVVKKNQSNLLGDSSGGTPTDLSQASQSIYGFGGTINQSAYGGGPFTRSVFSQSYDTGTESVADDEHADLSAPWADIRHRREEVKEILTDMDLEKMVDLTLTETETIWLLDMPAVCISLESDEADQVKTRNEKYQELVKSRVGNDRYAERGMNTFNEPPKTKNIQTTKIVYNDVGILSTTWDMYDTYEAIEKEARAKEEAEEEEEGTISRPTSPKTTDEQGEGDPAPVSRETTLVRGGSARPESRATVASSVAGSESVFASRETGVSSMPTDTQAHDEEKILKSENLKRDLFMMERNLNLNSYQPKQALYRGYGIITDIDREVSSMTQTSVADMGPNLDRLWSYSCPLTKGRNVSCMTWNKLNPDLIAVGYGQFEFTNQKGGYICGWSLKNPEFPERVFTCKDGVTALDFSTANPNLLAVGMYDGGVAIYNVRHMKDEPIVDNFGSSGKHTAPVWQIRWIEKERGSGDERAEVIVSISTDGRVTQWSIRKGFENYDLMRLKRVTTRIGGKTREKKGEAFISRQAGGLCFDFHSRDTNIYLAGTEEGHIHKCSCSYNEQYLESYSGHTSPVYKIQWSPFVPDIFLSCSADWSIRLWHQDQQKPILTFLSSTKAVNDISWSPRSSTVFACVNEGAVEVWDLNVSTLDPVIINNPTTDTKQVSVTFAKNSECILVGDSEGQVTVYQLRCMPMPPVDQVAALNGVIKASLASQLDNVSSAPPKESSDDFDLGI